MSHKAEMKKLQYYLKLHDQIPVRNVEVIIEAAEKTKIPQSLRFQIYLVLMCSSVGKKLFSETDMPLTSVEINTMILDAQNRTGLKETIVFDIVIGLLEACGISHIPVSGPILDKNNDVIIGRRLYPKDEEEKKQMDMELRSLKTIMDLLRQSGNADRVRDGQQRTDALAKNGTLFKLARYGVPEAFYLLGNYYYEKIVGNYFYEKTADANSITLDGPYMQYYQAAADEGVPEAFVRLGDIYYGGPNSIDIPASIRQIGLRNTIARLGHFNSVAYQYYSKPGAYPSDAEHRKKIRSIFAQKRNNIIMLLLNLITVVATFVFVLSFQNSAVDLRPYLTIGLIFAVLSALVFGTAVFYNYKHKYNSLRWSVFLNGFLWAVYFLMLSLN